MSFEPIDEKTDWGEAARGLQVRIAAVETNQPPIVSLEIRNAGVPETHAGSAQLFPHLVLEAERNGWVKEVDIKLDIPNRVWIRKDETFNTKVRIDRWLDVEQPGVHTISLGHRNHMISDIGDWFGDVRSPPLKIRVTRKNLNPPPNKRKN
ncbi:MAG: hypothetical protein AAF492_01015 [Verrucomicrobiota bacterium]